MLTTTGLHHLALRVTDLARSTAFSSDGFGMQVLLEVDVLALLSGHGFLLGRRAAADAGRADSFDPARVGLDHLALAVSDLAALEQMQLVSSTERPARGHDTVVLLEAGHTYTQSTAALRIARGLRGWWPLVYALIVVPAPIRDPVYRWIARNRYRWFGQSSSCRVPTPELRQRFL